MTKFLLPAGFAALGIYVGLIGLGRWLKRSARLELAAAYQLFSIFVALLVPLSFFEMAPELARPLKAGAIFSGAFVLLAILKRWLLESYFQKRGSHTPKFVSDLVALAVVTLSVLMILWLLYDVRIPGLLTGSGILAIILGLSMQETLGNIIAGVSLQFEKAFKTGDWLIVGDRNAEVMEINWRSTRLRATDNVYFDIPNSQLARQTVVNLSYPQRVHAMRIPVKVENIAPPNFVRQLLLHAASNANGVMANPAPNAFVNGFAESAIEYEVKFWLEDQGRYHEIRDSILTNIWYELDRHGIRLAYAKRSVQVDSKKEAPEVLNDKVNEAIRRQPVFQCLDEPEMQLLLKGGRSLRFGRGEKLIEQGIAGDSMFVLVGGEADVLLRNNGHFDSVATLHSGDCFGEMSLLTGQNRSATVVAKTDCNVIEIGKEAMNELLRRNASVAEKLSSVLAERKLQNEQAVLSRHDDENLAEIKAARAETFLEKVRAYFSL